MLARPRLWLTCRRLLRSPVARQMAELMADDDLVYDPENGEKP